MAFRNLHPQKAAGMKTVTDFNFQSFKTLVRVDFNVKLDNDFKVIDDTRIKACLPTINKIINDGGIAVLMSHMGRPKGEYHEDLSFKHIVPHLSELLQTQVHFLEDCISNEEKQKKLAGLEEGSVALLENLRFYPGEEAGDKEFAKKIARLGDVYVNDAFGTAHRAHASTYKVPLLFPEQKKMAGLLINNEVVHAEYLLKDMDRPYTAILGGSKVSDKIKIIRSLINCTDNILIGGGMAFTFLKALGCQIGKSIVEQDKIDLAQSIMDEAKANNVNLILPKDSIIASEISNESEKSVAYSHEIPNEKMGGDIGPESIEEYSQIITESHTIFWNGPVGVFEVDGFDEGTHRLGLAVTEATQKGAYSLIGGGDTATAFDKYNLSNQASFISTGGGALLTYIASERMPALEALEGIKEPQDNLSLE